MGFFWWVLIILVLDLVLLAKIGRIIGGGALLLWIVASALLGWLAIRTKGFRPRGRRPGGELGGMIEGGLVVVAGILLIFPGPLTDVLGLLLLVPALRRRVAARLGKAFLGGRVPWLRRGKDDGGAAGGESDAGEKSGRSRGAYPGADTARDGEFQAPPPDEHRPGGESGREPKGS